MHAQQFFRDLRRRNERLAGRARLRDARRRQQVQRALDVARQRRFHRG